MCHSFPIIVRILLQMVIFDYIKLNFPTEWESRIQKKTTLLSDTDKEDSNKVSSEKQGQYYVSR